MDTFFIFTVIVILIAVAAFSKAVSDTIQHHWPSSIFSKFDKQSFWGVESWVRKYAYKGIWKLLFSTVLVAFTDAWHLGNLVRKLAFYAAWGVSLAYFTGFPDWQVIAGLGAVSVLDAVVFHVFYHNILQKKVSHPPTPEGRE